MRPQGGGHRTRFPGIDVLLADILAGLTYEQIGGKHGVTRHTVANWVCRHRLTGHSAHKRGDHERGPRPPAEHPSFGAYGPEAFARVRVAWMALSNVGARGYDKRS
jgi:hypothetical protein